MAGFPRTLVHRLGRMQVVFDPNLTHSRQGYSFACEAMQGRNSSAPHLASNGKKKSRWRQKIPFWKGGKQIDGEIAPSTPLSVDDVSYRINVLTTESRNAKRTNGRKPRRSAVDSNNEAASPKPVRPSSLTGAVKHTDDAAGTTSFLPFVDMWEGGRNASQGDSPDETNSLSDPNALGPYTCRRMQSYNSILQYSPKSIASQNNSTVASDGVAAAAFAAATQAIVNCNSESATQVNLRGLSSSPRSVTMEMLSSNVQLLHEVHMGDETEPEPVRIHSTSAPGIKFAGVCLSIPNFRTADISSMLKSDLRTDFRHTDEQDIKQLDTRVFTEAPSIAYGADVLAAAGNDDDLFLRQKIRFDAIHKELYDDTTKSSDTSDDETQDSNAEIEDDEGLDDKYHIANSVLEKFGACFGCVPIVTQLLSSTQPVHDNALDEGTCHEQGSDDEDASVTAGTYDDQTLSTYRNRDLSSDRDDGSSASNSSTSSSFYSVDEEKGLVAGGPENTSFAESFMDQSHIYLMLTTARLERTASQKTSVHEPMSPVATTSIKNQSLVLEDSQDRILLCKESPTSPLGWIRHFQRHIYPTESHQIDDTRSVHARWLQAIREAKEKDGEWSPFSNTLESRREAAQVSLRRIHRLAMRQPLVQLNVRA